MWYLEWCLAYGVGMYLTILKSEREIVLSFDSTVSSVTPLGVEDGSLLVPSLCGSEMGVMLAGLQKGRGGCSIHMACVWQTPEFSLTREVLKIVSFFFFCFYFLIEFIGVALVNEIF